MTEEEKAEMLADGNSIKRRKNFAAGEDLKSGKITTLDEYIRFLTEIQKIFPPPPVRRRKTITKFNKL
ncbi:MAG: hypothetical protein U9N73_07600 [Candidatus Auribacterota bacterium]|nr:hypothetical protein [Candidatus Auribacterota bacterium]